MAYDKEKMKQYLKKWRLKNKEKIKQYLKKWRLKNKEKIKQYTKKYHLKNKEKLKKLKSVAQKKYYQKNKEYYKSYNYNYYCSNKLEINKKTNIKQVERYKTDSNYRITKILRRRVYDFVKNKKFKTMELLGCSIEKLWEHLESKFQPGMTRENHGKWHIDHIRPCISFNLTDLEQQKICFHYTNLQPLWAEDNLKKGAKYD